MWESSPNLELSIPWIEGIETVDILIWAATSRSLMDGPLLLEARDRTALRLFVAVSAWVEIPDPCSRFIFLLRALPRSDVDLCRFKSRSNSVICHPIYR